ncbi:MAG: preprotein translocase subunit SecG [Acidobacteria bacterium]|nr:MAG: preprotein translocase subunit SecG [Acidobacteriota bacterium]
MLYVLVPIYVLVCVFLILVVLLQQGKGADVASAFGAASSQTTFGARGTATVFEKVTTWSFVAFAVLAIAISIVQSRGGKSSVMKGIETKKAAAPLAPAPAAPAAPAPAAPATGAPAPAAPATAPQ